jgi:hypothetical protein
MHDIITNKNTNKSLYLKKIINGIRDDSISVTARARLSGVLRVA